MESDNLAGTSLTTKREMTRARAIKRFKWITISPIVVIFLVVLMPALILQLYFSFFGWTVYLGSWWDAEFVGFEIFEEVLTDERLGWAVIRSLYFSFGSTVGCFLVGFGLALLMYRPFKGNAFYYIMFIIPMLTVPIVVAYTGEMLLYQNGPINGILSSLLGHDIKVSWLADADIALTTVMIMEIWNWTPFSFIIMIAGLASLPKEPQEAAQILGAGKLRVFFEIQLPLLRPVILLALILRFLEAMAEYPKIWSLFQGGPGSVTETIPVLIYLTTWNYFEISKGAAQSYVVMILMILIVLGAIWVLRREKTNLDQMYK
jgi:multiple sugar transport system permease protein